MVAEQVPHNVGYSHSGAPVQMGEYAFGTGAQDVPVAVPLDAQPPSSTSGTSADDSQQRRDDFSIKMDSTGGITTTYDQMGHFQEDEQGSGGGSNEPTSRFAERRAALKAAGEYGDDDNKDNLRI